MSADYTREQPPRFVFASASAFTRWVRDSEIAGWGDLAQALVEDGITVLPGGRIGLLWRGVER
jgi:hypothetical protein